MTALVFLFPPLVLFLLCDQSAHYYPRLITTTTYAQPPLLRPGHGLGQTAVVCQIWRAVQLHWALASIRLQLCSAANPLPRSTAARRRAATRCSTQRAHRHSRCVAGPARFPRVSGSALDQGSAQLQARGSLSSIGDRSTTLHLSHGLLV